MGAVFTLDSTSINAILNAHSTFTKAYTRYGGKLSGQIFRMHKKPGEIQYQKADGSTGKRDAPMVYFDVVNFDKYEADFKAKIRPEDWEALMSIRNRTAFAAPLGLPPVEEVQQITSSQPQQGAPQLGLSQEDPIRLRANDPAVLPLFVELGALMGKDPTEELRMATVQNFPSVPEVVKYLKNKIKTAKAGQAKPATAADKVGAVTGQQAGGQVQQGSSALY